MNIKGRGVGEVVTVLVERMGQSGDGVGRLPDGRLLFVPGVLPGESASVVVREQHRSFARGELVLLDRTSPDRVPPVCPIYGECGGCTFQHWNYAAEAQYKENRVREALRRQGLSDAVVEAIRPSPNPYGYRNKGQFPFGGYPGAVTLGLYARKSHRVVPALHCDIQDRWVNEVLSAAADAANEAGLAPYREESREGVLRHLLVRSSRLQGRLLVLVVAARMESGIDRMAARLMETIPEIVGVGVNINASSANRVLGEETRLLAGEPAILERVSGLTFQLSLTSFFQVNPEQAATLYDAALGFLPAANLQDVWDLYSGVGTLAALAGRRAQRVRAVEVNRDAARDAAKNFSLNGLNNIVIEIGRVEDVMARFDGTKPDAVIVDPPRAGLDPTVVEALEQFSPRQIIYVSCNPETWARDVQRLAHYRLDRAVPVDMFPRTDHVEIASSLILGPGSGLV